MKNVEKEKILVEGRKLKQISFSKSKYSDWIKNNIRKNKLIKGYDYFIEEIEEKTLKNLKVMKLEYYFTEEASRKILLSQKISKFSEEIKKALVVNKDIYQIVEIANEKHVCSDIRIININDEEYPEQLRKIKNPPKQLYVKGKIENLKEIGIAVIGTRKPSIYGRRVCKVFANNLVGYNINIISGLARGIDSCGHKSCLEAKGKTIAVLPSGFNKVFPKENQGLLEEIIKKGGTVITEYPPDFEKTQESCRQRNRIMSGLAIGTLVIEAQERSGTSITVNYTIEQGKKAYAIPSSIYNSKGTGTNKMIKQGKAKMVTSVEDIIKDYPELGLKKREGFEFKDLNTPTKTKEKSNNKKEPIKIDEENLEVYNIIKKEPQYINEISRMLNKSISEVTYKVMLLEIDGIIKQLEDKKYTINEKKEE